MSTPSPLARRLALTLLNYHQPDAGVPPEARADVATIRDSYAKQPAQGQQDPVLTASAEWVQAQLDADRPKAEPEPRKPAPESLTKAIEPEKPVHRAAEEPAPSRKPKH